MFKSHWYCSLWSTSRRRSEVLQKLNYTNIHLFEPQKQLFKKLCESFSEDNEINLYNVGLGNQKAIKKLNLSPNNKGGVLLY